MSSVLEARGLTTGYGDIRVAWDLSVEVEAGKVTALLGRNGAGKTSTLRALAGLNWASPHSVFFDGRDVTSLPAYQRCSLGLAYVQEGKRVFRRRTVDENLRMGGYAARLSGRELATRLDIAYERFPILADRRKQVAGILSGGQQQMLAIGQALVSRPRVIMLDEPSAGLAPSIVADVLAVVRQLRDEGLGVLLVEQSVDFALAVADRIEVLDLGRQVYSAAAGAPGVRESIESAYFGRAAVG
jgi:branched-chain amino acid transport system ATP-binding protein